MLIQIWINYLPEILNILTISCSTSSSLLSRWRRGWESGNGAGPEIGLEVSSSTSSMLPSESSSTEPWLERGFCEAILGRHILRVALETRRRVTKIKETSSYVWFQMSWMKILTQVKDTVLDTGLTLCKLAGSDDVRTSGQRLVVWNHKKVLAIRSFHANEPRRCYRITWFLFNNPIKNFRKEIPKFFINSWIGIGLKEFKSCSAHNRKARLPHSSQSHWGYIDLVLKAIYCMEGWWVVQRHRILDN